MTVLIIDVKNVPAKIKKNVKKRKKTWQR